MKKPRPSEPPPARQSTQATEQGQSRLVGERKVKPDPPTLALGQRVVAALLQFDEPETIEQVCGRAVVQPFVQPDQLCHR